MVDAFVDEIKQVNKFFIDNREMLGTKAKETLHGQALQLRKRLISNRALFHSDVDAASKIGGAIKEGPWTTQQK